MSQLLVGVIAKTCHTKIIAFRIPDCRVKNLPWIYLLHSPSCCNEEQFPLEASSFESLFCRANVPRDRERRPVCLARSQKSLRCPHP